MEAYCVKCREKKAMENPVAAVMKNGRPITKGKCPDCGTAICRIGPAPDARAEGATAPGGEGARI